MFAFACGPDPHQSLGETMLTLFNEVLDREFFLDCGRFMLFSAGAAYVGANVRRLAVRHGWDNHFLHLSYYAGVVRRWRAFTGWRLWLSLGSLGGGAIALSLLVSHYSLAAP